MPTPPRLKLGPSYIELAKAVLEHARHCTEVLKSHDLSYTDEQLVKLSVRLKEARPRRPLKVPA